jgi:glycosyltransferase involved in cell wall biosynthesis
MAKVLKTQMPALPKITIVTPSFNQGKYIRETVESIVYQEYEKLEYFVVDGGSTDESVDLIKQNERSISWWISEKDKGQSDALMKGFSRGTGELFAWVNSDDILFPGCLTEIGRSYVQNGEPDLISANVAYIDKDSCITRFVRLPQQSRFLLSQGIWHVSAPVVFFKASLFRAIGGLDLNYHLAMDLDMWLRMMKRGARVHHIKKYLGAYRWHRDTKTAQTLRKQAPEWAGEIDEIWNNYAPNLTDRKVKFWAMAYKLFQLLNLNYLREFIDHRQCGSTKYWQDVVKSKNVS